MLLLLELMHRGFSGDGFPGVVVPATVVDADVDVDDDGDAAAASLVDFLSGKCSC